MDDLSGTHSGSDKYDDEAALLAGLRAGDDAAYAALVRTHTGPMLAVARRILSTEEDARDAVQEAFLSAFKSITHFEGGAKVSTWLHRIVVNAALMKLRSRRRSQETSIDELLPTFRDDGHQAHGSTPWKDGLAAAEERELSALVRRFIDQLPENYRIVLMLRDIEELSTEETAQMLGIQPNAVKTRLHRARQALRTLLDPHMRKGGE
ncbi:MAG: RNA polymerase subunit sigma-24 [Planctomycetota bacterium]|nr:MAG: RNA polymerase subunit sigma-24 [Planctomycetota bacterium]